MEYRWNPHPDNPYSSNFWESTDRRFKDLSESSTSVGRELVESDDPEKQPILSRIGIGAFFGFVAVLLFVLPFWS